MDLPDITLIIQWKATCDSCTSWQWFRCAICDLKLEGGALFLVEPKYFDATKKAQADAAEWKWKTAEWAAGNLCPAKCTWTAKGLQTIRLIADMNERDEHAPAETNEGSSNKAVLPTGPCTTILNGTSSNTAPATSNNASRAVFEPLWRMVYAEIPKAK